MFDYNRKINPRQKVLTAAQYRKLVENHKQATTGKPATHPVVKFFTTNGVGLWLLSELDPETGIAFGLCDLGYPELGYVSLDEMIEVGEINRNNPFRWVERDLHFNGEKTLDEYKAMRDQGKHVFA